MEYLPPDMRTITVPGYARIFVPELLFAPQLNGFEEDSLPKAIVASILATKMNAHAAKFYSNIVLTGNTSRLSGLSTRLQIELEKLAPGTEINVIAYDPQDGQIDRKAWLGTMMEASTGKLDSQFISNTAYKSVGLVNAINAKCTI